MNRCLTHHLGSRLLALVMSWVILAPKVIYAYDLTKNNNLAVYWGQDDAGTGQPLSNFCQDNTIDNIIMAFLDNFGINGGQPQPQLNLANSCIPGNSNGGNGSKKKRQPVDCASLSSQIKQCQSNGKIVTLSLGGADSQVGFSSDSQAKTFADTIWHMFLGGSGQQRPFGDAVLDGIDLDIEHGTPTGYAAFVNRLRQYSNNGTNKLYITAAPQCPFPDVSIGQALNAAHFDAVYVQFYNNYCGVAQPQAFNFAAWDNWAKRGSANPNIKVYIGAMAKGEVDGRGYVDANTLASYITKAQSTWSSFGGVMLWEASLAVANNNYHKAVKSSLLGGGAAASPLSANGTATASLSNGIATSTSRSRGGSAPGTPSPDGFATSSPSAANGAASSSLGANGGASTPLSAPCNAPTSQSAHRPHGARPTSFSVDGATPSSPSADGAASTPLSTSESARRHHGARPTSFSVDGATPSSPSADGAASTPLSAPLTAPTSESAHRHHGARPTSLSGDDATSNSLNAAAAGAKRHRRSRLRNRLGAAKHSHS